MSFTKALFYPTIDIRNEEFLKNAILFWDEIHTIVPSAIESPYQENITQYLADKGILKPVKVDSDDKIIKELTNEVLSYISTNEGVQMLDQENTLFQIHPGKLSYEIQRKLERNLSKDGWVNVDKNFGNFYMTLLANKISEQNGIGLLTDNNLASNLSDVTRFDNLRTIKNDAYEDKQISKKLTQGLFINLVVQNVQISKLSTIEDIINFKEKHSDELGHFRTNVAKLTEKINTQVSFEALHEQIQTVYKDEFLPSYNNFKKALEGSKIKFFSDSFMKVSFFSTAATSVPLVLLGLTMPYALIAGAGVSMIANMVAYNVDKQEKLRANPYSYLLSLNKSI
jgi:hypothetical protein